MKQLRTLLLTALALLGAHTAFAQSPNNNLADRYMIVPGATTTNGSTTGNNRESGEVVPGGIGGFNGSGNAAGQTLWYEWISPTTGNVNMTATAAGYRVILVVWTGSAHPLTQLAGNRAGSAGGTASVTFSATAGASYKVMIDNTGFGGGSGTGPFSLTTPEPAVVPVVTLTSPTTGLVTTNPTPVTFTATASSGGGAVTNVSYYYGANILIGSATSSPFTFAWNNPPAGTHTVYARATDTAGATGQSGAATITVRPFGYFSYQLIGFDSNNVWKYSLETNLFGTGWETVGYDDDAWPSGPAGLGVDVSANGVPIRTTNGYAGDSAPQFFRRHFNLAVPTNGLTFALREVVEDAAVYYINGVEVRRSPLAPADNPLTVTSRAAGNQTDPTPIQGPYSFPATGIVQGDNVIAVVVLQNGNASSDIELAVELTAEGAINNAAPTVSLTAPANGALFPIGTNITLTATASDSDGTVTNVAFYAGTTKLGDDATAPYEFTWNNVAQGVYSLTAIAFDNNGTTNISSAVSVTVNDFLIVPVSLIPTGAVWKYFDQGVDQGTAWKETAFNDSGWSNGVAELGYGDTSDGRPEATVVSFGPDSNNKYPTTYFRRAFVVTNAAAITNLAVRLMRDDGAVVYINGTEIRRDNLPLAPLPIGYLTNAIDAVTLADEATYFATTNTAALNNGTNVIAVEVHQNNSTSSDLSFDLELIAYYLEGLTFTNSAAPFVASQNPAAGATVPNLSSVQVTFSESVSGVNASDLLVNGTAATGVAGGPAVYTFTFPQPPFGPVNITWAVGHGIVDQDLSPLPFDGAAASNTWSYILSDQVAPTILARNPAANAVVTNLTSVTVSFSEPVANVNAGDLLINGSPASGLTVNSASNYTFTFGQPQAGTVNITWAVGHGITDTSPSANAFNATGPGATWSYTLTVAPTVLVASNGMWRFFKGLTEASSPVQAWRAVGFDDSSWSNAPAPFYYGDPYGPGTELTDMQGNYQSVYMRRTFTLVSTAAVVNFIYKHQIDDGLVAWINGVEVLRVNMAASGTDPSYQPGGVGNATEPNNNGAGYITVTNTLALGSLIQGTNVLAIQACNASLGASSDFGVNMQFEATIIEVDPAFLPPRVAAASPPSGDVFSLSNLQVTFTEPVVNVGASDLLINGVPATGLSGSGSNYTFTFTQPAYGPVSVTWAVGHGIEDTDVPPKNFDATAAGNTFSYSLVNPSAPTIFSQSPVGGFTISNLTQIQVTFSEAVQGVNAADLLIAGAPATGVSGGGASYTFTFPQPPYGPVAVSWAGGHGITDTEPGLNAFDPSRPGNTWSYTLVDFTAPTVAGQNPAAGANVTNLTQLSVTFSEAVLGVNASDLLINGVAATGVSGGPTNFTFTFAQPNTSVVNVEWATTHGITDASAQLNAFNATGPGATWQYFTPDNVAPTIASITPPPGATIRDLTAIAVTFAEPVIGVTANDLLLNGAPAGGVSGASAGPYTFTFTQPATGSVEVAWAVGHGITDLAVPTPNPFVGAEFTYVLDPNAVFADKVVFNEIYFHPSTERTNQEWIELHNTDVAPVNLTGWRLTKGVSYTFPNVTIAAGGYLVVAASVDEFQIKYPGVTNVVGNWTGTLNNTGEELELETATGEEVDSVEYADNGDWAIRQRGPQDVANANPLLNRGWDWFSPADGAGTNTANGASEGGRSLELRNPRVPNQHGQNWGFSTQTNGTPGVANNSLSTNIPPMILDVAHFPPVPTPADGVTITARVRDEQTNGHTVTLFRRNHTSTSPGAFVAQTMFDDGLHNDGLANDGVYGATNAPDGNGTVIEFYVRAVDQHNRTNTWPAAARQLDGSFQQTANALYQVDNEVAATNMPHIRLVLTGSELNEYYNQLSQNSDAEMNATFISMDGEGTKVRYLAGMRIRGAGSRGGTPKNNRVNFPSDNRWNGRTEMNFNNRYTHIQAVGSALALKSGLVVSSARPVLYRLNGVAPTGTSSGSPQYGAFVQVEPVGGELVENHYPNDGDGNVYRASTGAHNADFTNFGTNGAQYVARGYTKTSNGSENDWSDMNQLTLALQLTVPESNYVQGVRTIINVTNWMRYFAVCSLLEYSETSLCVGRGDDYAMYRGVVDPRFTLIAHDFDTILGFGDSPGLMNTAESIWAMVNGQAGGAALSVPVLPRFVRHPAFVPTYFAELKRLGETVFNPTNADPVINQILGNWTASSTIPAMQSFLAARTASVLSQIPLTYSLVHTLPLSNGVARSTSPSITLRGTANAIDTRIVRVNGQAGTYSAWEGRWTNSAVALQPGYNNLLVEFVGETDTAFATNLVVWYDPGTFNDQSGTLGASTIWSPGSGPYRLTGAVTVPNGGTLTIQPGTTVYLNSGVSLNVTSGGRILAEGTPTANIHFLPSPGPSNRWGGIVLNGSGSSPESRIAYAYVAGNNNTAIDVSGAAAVIDHVTFGTTDRRCLDLDAASFVVSHCWFPGGTAAFEPVHGSGGIRAGGRGVILRNFFGKTMGYNDTIDFTGGNRPGPVLHILDNVFTGSDDDILDLDGTDAWVEGNIFLHAHRNGSPDSASAVSGGNDSGQTSEITIIRNIFYDVDQAATAKQGNFYNFINNTVVRQNSAAYEDAGLGAVLNFADDTYALALGMYAEGNILYDVERLTRYVTNGTALFSNITFHNNLMPLAWAGAGTNNSTANPLLTYVPQLSETTNFTSWEAAQVFRTWFALQPASPALATGPNGRDKGGLVASGASLSGEPAGTNSQNSATLLVGPLRTGNSIPSGAAAFPNGSGFTHYKWRLDLGPWSAETPTATPISVTGLAPGMHRVDVVGKLDTGLYQDDTNFGPLAVITESRTWTVNTNLSPVRINEILAANTGVFVHSATTPDVVELYNASASPVSLDGMRLTDDPTDPDKFVFPVGTTIPGGGYLLVYADNAATPGLHLGFSLSADGEGLHLYASADDGGALLESVVFGLQLDNLSIGRLPDGSWNLCQPTLGGPNVAAGLGDPARLRINEWLAVGLTLSPDDFIEIYNLDTLPVALGGLFLTDEPNGWPNRHTIPALSFIAGGGYRAFKADGNADNGADHLNFQLSADQGLLGLFNRDLSAIDCVVYLAQRVDISEGRSPNGSSNVIAFTIPTPGAPNQSVLNTNSGVVINEVLANNQSLLEADGTTPDWIELHNLSGGTVDISDMSLTDNTLLPRRYVFAPGTTIGPVGYLRLLCNPDLPASTTNTGFGLKSTGGSIYLFDKVVNGGGLVSAISHGLQPANYSIGRVPNGSTNWVLTVPTPAFGNAAVSPLGDVAQVRINEWMASPATGDDWFELYNPNAQPVAIGGMYLTDTLANRTLSQIPALSFIGAGDTNAWQRFWADGNVAAGADHVNFSLRANGEAIGFSASASVAIDSITFPAQQTGVSEGRFPDGNATITRFPLTPSPGDANYLLLSNVVVNEALAHTDLPLEDAIELRNLTASPVNIGNWWLSDSKTAPKKYRIPNNTILPANGYIVFYEYQFNADTNDPAAFSLSSGNGDDIYLSAADSNGILSGFRAEVDFGASINGVSFGRYLTSDGREEFVAMSARSFGQDDPGTVAQFRTGTGLVNPYPKVGPVVISQIMYHPPDIGTNDNSLDEFIELRNISGSPVPLYDTSAPTNTWRLRDAVDFDFPGGVTLPAGSNLLVVSFDPVADPGQLAAFRGTYGIPSSIPVYGPYTGKLANNDDDIELRRPDFPNPDGVPSVLVERVHYYDAAPWPQAADGSGFSLNRVSLTGFGNDPTNWLAAAPNFGGVSDSDGDGMPNWWENQYTPTLNPNVNDAALDPDGDGMTNLQEYLAGTNPTQFGSALRITSVEDLGGNNVRLRFFAVSNKTYAVQFKTNLTDTAWITLSNITAAPTNRSLAIDSSVPTTNRFYRLRTP